MNIDDLFGDSSPSAGRTGAAQASDQILSRLATENGSVHVLACREEQGLKLTVCAGTRAWAGVLIAAELSSMASVVGMEPEEFTQETERALTGRSLGTENFAYSIRYEAERLHLAWKRHLPADNIKFQLGSVSLEQEESSSTVKALLDHAVDTTQCLQDKIRDLERENLRLVQERKMALQKLEECACLKEQIEADLYSKFKLVLNGKKSKIRHLMDELASCQTQHQSSTATDKTESPKQETNSSDQDKSPQHTTPPPSGLLGEPQEIVSPPVKRRKREARPRGSKELPHPPSISRPPVVNDRVGDTSNTSATVDSDDLLQLL